MESEQLFHRGYYRNSYNSIRSASSDEELLDGAGAIMDFQTSEDDTLLDGDTAVGKCGMTTENCRIAMNIRHEYPPMNRL